MTSLLWDAPFATGPVEADVVVPGSKSMTNRALLLAALADGRSQVQGPLRSRDTSLMAAALRALGAVIDDIDDAAWTIDGGAFTDRDAAIDVGNAGTVLRFVPPVAALSGAAVGFDGDDAARRRPVAELLDALRDLGAAVDDRGRGTLPFVVTGKGAVRGGPVRIDASTSSQLVSALLLAGARYDDGVEVSHVGERPVPNAPHLAMTTAMLQERGVHVTTEERRWVVRPGPIATGDYRVEPDLSSAAPFLAAAVVTAGRVRIWDWPESSTQPGALLPQLLRRFGATAAIDGDGLVVRGPSEVTGADLDLRDAGELTPVLAAIAAVATSPSRFTGIDYLRGHETDRLAALAREISRLGGDVRELDDGLEIFPKPLHGNVFSTYDDHRLVMAAAVLGLVTPDLQVENVGTTDKTFPDFARQWEAEVDDDGAAR